MKTICYNCRKEFEDSRPAALINMVQSGVTDEDLLRSSVSAEPYCPECSEEGARLNKIVKSMIMAASHQAEIELKAYGERQRRNRRQAAENTRVLEKVEEFLQKYRPHLSVFDDNCSPDPDWYEELSDELDSLRLAQPEPKESEPE